MSSNAFFNRNNVSVSTENTMIDSNRSTSRRQQSAPKHKQKPNPPPKKPANEVVRAFFTIDELPLRTEVVCKKCGWYKSWARMNATKLRQHIINQCVNATNADRIIANSSSQHAKRMIRQHTIISCAKNGTQSGELFDDVIATKVRARAKNTTQTLLNVKSYTKTDYENVLTREIEVVLARFEPINRLYDPIFQNKLVQEHSKHILQYLPVTVTGLIEKYVQPIDTRTKQRLVGNLKAMGGNASIEVDGVTAKGRSYLLYTLSKGKHSFFLKLAQLESSVHVRTSEINDAVTTIEETEQQYGVMITNMAVDNAATSTMNDAVTTFLAKFPDHPPITQTRDPSHCIDLVAKDSTRVSSFKKLLEQCSTLIDFLRNDKINGMVDELLRNQTVNSITRARKLPDTRFSRTAQTFRMIQSYKTFLAIIEDQVAYKTVISTRSAKQKTQWAEALNIPNRSFWLMLDAAIQWFDPISTCQEICSSNSFPMSAYLPLIQSLRNELNIVINNETFKSAFSVEFRIALAAFVDVRWNMDGTKSTTSQKVGLISKNQIWAHLIDPYRQTLPAHVVFLPTVPQVTNDMVNFYSNERNVDELKTATNMYFSQLDTWKHRFPTKNVLPLKFANSDPTVANLDQKKLRMKHVVDWVGKTGGIEGRIAFFALFEDNPFTKKIAMPLLSFRTSGSMSVERTAKPFKRQILTKERNRLINSKAELFLRVGLNLRILSKDFVAIKQQVYESNERLNQTEITNDCYGIFTSEDE